MCVSSRVRPAVITARTRSTARSPTAPPRRRWTTARGRRCRWESSSSLVSVAGRRPPSASCSSSGRQATGFLVRNWPVWSSTSCRNTRLLVVNTATARSLVCHQFVEPHFLNIFTYRLLLTILGTEWLAQTPQNMYQPGLYIQLYSPNDRRQNKSV